MKNFRTMFSFLKLAHMTYRPMFYVLAISALVNTVSGAFTACSLALLVAEIEKGNAGTAIKIALIVALVDVILLTAKRIIDGIMQKCKAEMDERISQTVAAKIMSLPFACLEDSHYLELKNNALMGINNMGAIYSFFNGFLAIVSNVITLTALGIIITSFEWKIILVMAAGIVLTFLVTILSTKEQISFFNDLLPINFKYAYYINTLSDTALCKDFRLYSIYDVMIRNLKNYQSDLEKYFFRIAMKQGLFDFLLSTIRYSVLALVYIGAGLKTLALHTSVAQFTLTASAALSFSSAVSEIISAGGSFVRGIEYVKPILEFMNIREDADEGTEALKNIRTIEFDHVSFTYPNTTEPVLDDISFSFNSHEKISIVGLNGAGKTTIVKLLCRLYKPDQGEIRINGSNIYDYSYDSYMKQISSVFQDYKLFDYSILDNIAPDMEKERGETLLEDVGLKDKIAELPQGICCCLGKSLNDDGVELSGGQQQKLAIARALAKQADLLIMDEPTSALDPIAEAEIYENFNSLANNRTAIYISHRMSSSIFCDRILVLNKGKVEAYAPHEDLMKDPDSLYYRLFMTQAENYQIS